MPISASINRQKNKREGITYRDDTIARLSGGPRNFNFPYLTTPKADYAF